MTLYPDLDTPSLLVHLDVMRDNIAEMMEVARRAGVRLRPHMKTHKCPGIARMQVEAGATGITVAKLGEAEVMADAGFDDLLIAYPIVGEAKLKRLRKLMERASVRVSLDAVEVAQGVGDVGRSIGRDIPVLIEVDTGLHRLGRPPGDPTVDLVLHVASVTGIEVIGLLTHAGHAYRCTGPEELRAAAEREGLDLVETAGRCRDAGIELREISVGSTPTARSAAKVSGVTEIRPGTYVFNDVQQVSLGVATEQTCAARILATVVARPAPDRFVIDAGTKALTSDGFDIVPFPGWGLVAGRPDLRLEFLSEEHGVGRIEGSGGIAIGDRMEVIPLHVCGCVNMFDVAYGVRDGQVAEELQIEARGTMN